MRPVVVGGEEGLGVGLDQEVAFLDRDLEDRRVVAGVPVEDDLTVNLEDDREPQEVVSSVSGRASTIARKSSKVTISPV